MDFYYEQRVTEMRNKVAELEKQALADKLTIHKLALRLDACLFAMVAMQKQIRDNVTPEMIVKL